MGQAAGDQQDGSTEDRWVGRPLLAAALKAALYAVPLAASSVAVVVLARVVPVFGSRLLWLATLGAVAVAVSVLFERLARRLIPLATLLKLTMLFPDKAPSRYKLARSAGNPEVLAERLARKRDTTALGAAEQVLSLITALGNHDRRTRGHSERVRVFADLLAEELRLDQPSRDRLRWAALLHDLGKLTVAASVLNKPAKLDDREFTLMKQHPERGAELAAPLLPWLGEWGRGILEHHEKYDGSGYPAGLTGTDISSAGRVIGLVDAFETMTAARPYKKPMATRAARQELTDCAGAHFDPVMVRAFLSVSLPRLVWAMGPLSFLVQLPMLSALAQTGTRASQLGGQAAVTASTVASAGVVATAGVLPWAAPAAYEQRAPEQAAVAASAATSLSAAPGDDERPATPEDPVVAPASPTDVLGAPGSTGLDGFGDAVAGFTGAGVEPSTSPDARTPRTPRTPSAPPAPRASAPARGTSSPEPAPTPAPEPPAPERPAPPPVEPAPAPGEPDSPPPAEPAPSASPTASPSRPGAPSPTPTRSPSPSRPATPKPPPPPAPTRPPTPPPTLPPAPLPPVEAPAPTPVLPPPTVVLDSAPESTRTTAGVAVVFHSPDPLANAFQCRLDDAVWVDCASSATPEEPATWTVFPSNGDHEVFVRAASLLSGWGEPVSTGTFTMSVPPRAVLDDAPTGTLSDGNVLVAFSSPDPSVTSFACSVDGGAWTTCSSPLARRLANGEHEVRVRATNPAGTGSAASTGTFTVAAPRPVVELTQVPVGTVTSGEVELRFASPETEASFACSVNGSAYDACASPLSLSLPDGTHTVAVRATSPWTGTGAPSSTTFVVDVADATGPATVLDAVPDATVTTSSATVAFSSADPAATFRCSVDGRAVQACTNPLELTDLPNGPHTVRVHAVGSDGVPGASVSTSFTTAVPPTLVLDEVPSGTVTTATVTARFSSDRADAVFACSVDDGPPVACTSPWTVELANGAHTLTVQATDPATGATTTRTTPSFTVEIRPQVTITAAPTGTVGTTFSLSFVSDVAAAVFECVADSGTAWARCLSGDTFTLPAGQHTMSVRALAGGVYGPPATTATFTVADDSGPLVVSGKPDSTTTATTATFTWHGGTTTDYQCRLDNGNWLACTSGITYTGLAPDTYKFGVRSMGLDEQGQYSNIDTVYYTWTVVAP